jgi:hypothetical protein
MDVEVVDYRHADIYFLQEIIEIFNASQISQTVQQGIVNKQLIRTTGKYEQ